MVVILVSSLVIANPILDPDLTDILSTQQYFQYYLLPSSSLKAIFSPSRDHFVYHVVTLKVSDEGINVVTVADSSLGRRDGRENEGGRSSNLDEMGN